MKKELFKGLTDEQLAKVKACKNSDELLALAKAEGIQLNDEQLAAVNGGCGVPTAPGKCPKCKSEHIHVAVSNSNIIDFNPGLDCECYDCGHKWHVS